MSFCHVQLDEMSTSQGPQTALAGCWPVHCSWQAQEACKAGARCSFGKEAVVCELPAYRGKRRGYYPGSLMDAGQASRVDHPLKHINQTEYSVWFKPMLSLAAHHHLKPLCMAQTPPVRFLYMTFLKPVMRTRLAKVLWSGNFLMLSTRY